MTTPSIVRRLSPVALAAGLLPLACAGVSHAQCISFDWSQNAPTTVLRSQDAGGDWVAYGSADNGTVPIYSKFTPVPTLLTTLRSPVPNAPIAWRFGWVVSIDAPWIAISEPSRPPADGFNAAGAVLLFRYDGTNFIHSGTTNPPNNGSFAPYGFKMDLDYPWVAVVSDRDSPADTPRVHLHEHVGGTWVFRQSILLDSLASSLAVNGNDLFVTVTGPSGSLQVDTYRLANGSWDFQQTITPSLQASPFGPSIATEGEWLVVGAPSGSAPNGNVGRAYIYRNVAGVWTQNTVLTPPSNIFGGTFGDVVTIDQDRIAVLFRNLSLNNWVVLVYRQFLPGQWAFEATAAPNPPGFVAHGEEFISLNGSRLFTVGRSSTNSNDVIGAHTLNGILVGDANGDGMVEFEDITELLSLLGEPVPPFRSGDSNGDGFITFTDITAVLSNFGAACP